MKDVVLSTGQTATIRTKDELTEGQSRKIAVARSRHDATLQRYRKPLYLEDGRETFEVTSERAMIDGVPKVGIPAVSLDGLTDEEWANVYGLTDVLISVLTESLNGEPLGDPTALIESVHDALSEVVSEEYTGVKVTQDTVDEKIDPLVAAAESTPSSSEDTPT